MKRILVIGASGLIGRAIVDALADRADVVRASLSRAPEKVDISSPDSLRALFSRVGQVDAIVCTGGMARFQPMEKATDEDWAYSLANKLMGQVNVVRMGVSSVGDGGSITLTTGVLAQHPMPGSAIITTVNIAVEGFVRAAALEMSRGIRVNAVSPGWITDTLKALGMDPAAGIAAPEVAKAYVQLIEGDANGTVVVAAK
jgi:NAD(P)-dependent dehydrogenase (short-subunit alcohol dehydrogenase family)